MSFTHLDLFAGIGGFSLSARWMGWKTLAWCEWNEFCQKVLRYHFPDAEGFSDITKTDFTKYANRIDVLTGGFPCQGFSVAGKRKGKQDDRYLWPEMFRAIREIRPRWVVGENVPGIVTWEKGMVVNEIKTNLEDEGFTLLPPIIIPACGKNAPHRRDRVWFIAFSDKNRKVVQGRNGNCNNKKWHSTKEIQKRENKFSWVEQSDNEVITDTKRFGQQGQGWPEGQGSSTENRNWKTSWANADGGWPTQPALRSGNDGIPNGLAEHSISKKDYLKFSLESVGNSIVPQIAFEIFKTIQEYEDLKSNIPWCVKN